MSEMIGTNPNAQGPDIYRSTGNEVQTLPNVVPVNDPDLQRKAFREIVANYQQDRQTINDSGVFDANGAPMIDGVRVSFSAEDLADALRLIGSKTKDAQLNTLKEDFKIQQGKIAENHQKTLDKIDEWAQKCADAGHAAKTKSILGWVAKALAFVGALVAVVVAAVATVATAGAAAPALVLACVGLAAASISLSSAVSQECGGPPLELSSLISRAVGAILEECGVAKEKAESLGKIISGSLACLATAGAALLLDPAFATNVIVGSMELGGVDPDTVAKVSMAVSIAVTVTVGITVAVCTMGIGSASAVSSIAGQTASMTAKMVGRSASLVQGIVTVASGGVQVGSGVSQIQESQHRHGADMALSDKKKLEAAVVAMMKAMEEDNEEMKKIVKEIEDSMQSISDLIASSAASMSEITRNIRGGRATV